MPFDMNEILEINKFSHLHDGDRIFFCKTDFIEAELARLGNIDKEVILISGNSDFGITDALLSKKPSNVKHWFTANKSTQSDEVTVIPLGIENITPCSKGSKSGYCWPHAKEKHRIISNINDAHPSKLIYANFTVDHRRHHSRELWRDISQHVPHITWRAGLSYLDMCEDILDHEAALCPLGNKSVPEGDNHRVYEVLYLGRIPIVHTLDYYKKLYHLFPVILIENLEAIQDEDFMKHKIKEVKSKNFDSKYLKFSYWKEQILRCKEQLN